MGYLINGLSGVGWMGSFRFITRLFAFVRIAILARLLSPEQFGIFGIASLSLVFVETITLTGVWIYIIQEKKKLEDFVNAAWFLSIVRGLSIALLLVVSSKFISGFFNSPESYGLLLLIASVALIRGFINPARIKYIKDLKFKKEFLFSFCIFTIDAAVTIITAYVLRSPVSLVYGLIAGAIMEVALSFKLIKPTPKFVYEPEKIKVFLSRGKWVTGSAIFKYFFEQGDDAVVGKLLGTSSLGIYQQAYKISTLPITEVARIFNQVTFPLFSIISEDKKRLKKAFLKTLLTTLLIVVPIGSVLHIYSYEIVLIVLGVNWVEVAPVLKVLAIFGVIHSITLSTYPLFNSLKKQNYVTLITFSEVFIMAITIIPLVFVYGTRGAGLSVLISSIISLPITFFMIHKALRYNRY
jgi:lipopolysaccharide exporter